jgi:hypothetical protein
MSGACAQPMEPAENPGRSGADAAIPPVTASLLCTLPVEPPDVDPAHFERRYRARRRAVVIRNATSHIRQATAFRAVSSVQALRAEFGSARVTVSSANAFSYGRQRMLLREYLDGMGNVDYGGERRSSSGEIYYWFGEHGEELQPLLDMYPLPALAFSSADFDLVAFATEAGGSAVAVPPPPPALSFGVAGDGSGVPFHTHNDGFAEVLHGAKRWLFHDGEEAPPGFHPNKTSLAWIRETLPTLPRAKAPRECTIYPGDLVYFPKGVWHSTVNVGITVFMSTFL